MKQEATCSNDKVAVVCHLEDCIVSIAPAALDALYAQSHEQEVCEGVDDLGGVDGSVVVLYSTMISPASVVFSSRTEISPPRTSSGSR